MPKYFVSVVPVGFYETEIEADSVEEAADFAVAEAYADGDPLWEMDEAEVIEDEEEKDD